jgi:hypothetical protein
VSTTKGIKITIHALASVCIDRLYFFIYGELLDTTANNENGLIYSQNTI